MKRKFNVLSLCVLGIAAILIAVQVQAGTKMLTPRVPQKTFPVTSRKTFTINANEFYNKASQYGYNSYAHKKSWNATCKILLGGRDHGGNSVLVRAGSTSSAIGSTCDFSLFEGTLKNNFVYKDFTPGYSHSTDSNKASMNLTKKPSEGSTSVNFKYHGWAESFQSAYRTIEKITLEGPENLTWDRAFH